MFFYDPVVLEGEGQFESLRSHGHGLFNCVALRDGLRNVRKRNDKAAVLSGVNFAGYSIAFPFISDRVLS
jgi:hypothetical protein